MKKIQLFAIGIIAVAIFILMSTATDASTYVTFHEAQVRAQEGNTTKVHVVGRLPKAPDGSPSGLLYDPVIDPNHFEFTLIDTLKQAQRVVYYNPKPADFDRSDQVVITGAMRGDTFVADQILLKCPSKYTENELKAETAAVL
jgi:cytochrome c-type biogenesis protein CcmE